MFVGLCVETQQINSHSISWPLCFMHEIKVLELLIYVTCTLGIRRLCGKGLDSVFYYLYLRLAHLNADDSCTLVQVHNILRYYLSS